MSICVLFYDGYEGSIRNTEEQSNEAYPGF